MKKTGASIRLLTVFAIALAWARADVSPTAYIGSGIVAQSESTVHMEKADVEIVWGTPCSLSATFKMVNPSADARDIRIGFPMPVEVHSPKKNEPPELTLTFDGEATPVALSGTGHDERYGWRAWTWYHCRHTFKPGNTTVVVKTPLRASLVYGGAFQESLFYCIQTGANWAGSIGAEEVTIRFPYPIGKDQITGASPAGYQVDGNCVRWSLVDFEPTADEYDISLTYLRPDVARILSTLREEVAREPKSSSAAIKLAKHLLVLGMSKSNAGFPPQQLSKEQYRALLRNISSRKTKALFKSYYRPTAEGHYGAPDSEWTDTRVSMIQVLGDAGYRDEESQSPLILEGERLLKTTLKRDPHNAEAWNVYLANYWRFSFAAVGHWFGQVRLNRTQAKAIETAAKNCPNDEGIRLWLKLLRSPPNQREEIPPRLSEMIRQRVFHAVDFPEIKYDYY